MITIEEITREMAKWMSRAIKAEALSRELQEKLSKLEKKKDK